MKLPFVEKVNARKEAPREKKAKEQFKRLYTAYPSKARTVKKSPTGIKVATRMKIPSTRR